MKTYKQPQMVVVAIQVCNICNLSYETSNASGTSELGDGEIFAGSKERRDEPENGWEGGLW